MNCQDREKGSRNQIHFSSRDFSKNPNILRNCTEQFWSTSPCYKFSWTWKCFFFLWGIFWHWSPCLCVCIEYFFGMDSSLFCASASNTGPLQQSCWYDTNWTAVFPAFSTCRHIYFGNWTTATSRSYLTKEIHHHSLVGIVFIEPVADWIWNKIYFLTVLFNDMSCVVCS